MAKAAQNDFVKAMENMFSANSFDANALNDLTKNATEFTSKLSKIALTAAEKNAELTSTWTKETLSKLDAAIKVQKDPADYAKVVSDFAAAQTQSSPEHVAAFAEVAKKAQIDAVELLMAAGKEVQAEATAAVKKAAV